METHEIIGWIGNVFVILQFLMSDIKKLRIFGLLGASVWLIVAIMIGNISLMMLNIIIIGIQIYHIYKLMKEQKQGEPWNYPIGHKELTSPIVSSIDLDEREELSWYEKYKRGISDKKEDLK
jgi:hypothetical protein